MSNIKPVDDIKNTLKQLEPQFKMALPSHIPLDRFIRVAQTAITSNPNLLQADRTSLFAACMKSAQDGLMCDNKEAALVTFKTKQGTMSVQYMPMLSGILKKIRNSGELSSITSQLVYEKDNFKYWIDSEGEHLEHYPEMFDDRGKVKGVYALAKTKDGSVYIEVMTTEQVMAIKKSSRSSEYGPWSGPFETEMWKKSAIRRLSKRLPMSTDLESTIHADDDLYDIPKEEKESEIKEIKEVEEKQTKPKRLAQALKSKDETIKVEVIEEVSSSQPEKIDTL